MNLAFRNVVEVITEKEYKELLEKKNFKFYIGIAPTGPFHIGYLVPLGKFVDLMKLGGKGTILIADWHAYLDDRKTPWEEMEIRSKYYERCAKEILKNFIDIEEIRFVRGSEFQKNSKYIEDIVRASGIVTVKRAIRAASEVVRLRDDPHVSELLYPIMQCLDVKHLNVDLAIGGIDQRHIYALAREILPKLGYKPGVYVFTPLITSLKGPGVKMSASKPETCIFVHDSPEEIKRKVLKAYCPIGEVEGNPIVDIAKFIIIPIMGEIKVVNEKTGEERVFKDVKELEEAFKNKEIHPLDLKNAVANHLMKLLESVGKYFERHQEFLEEVKKSFEKSGYKIFKKI